MISEVVRDVDGRTVGMAFDAEVAALLVEVMDALGEDDVIGCGAIGGLDRAATLDMVHKLRTFAAGGPACHLP